MSKHQKVSFYEVVEKLTRKSIYELIQKKEQLLAQAEQVDLFDVDEEVAMQIVQEREALQKEVNLIKGYVQIVEQLASAYLEALQEAQTFDLIKHTELEIVYSEWAKLERACKQTHKLNSILTELKKISL